MVSTTVSMPYTSQTQIIATTMPPKKGILYQQLPMQPLPLQPSTPCRYINTGIIIHKTYLFIIEEEDMCRESNKTEHMVQAVIITAIIEVDTTIITFQVIAGLNKV